MNLRVSKLKALTKSKSQQAAAVGVACTFERYAVTVVMAHLGERAGASPDSALSGLAVPGFREIPPAPRAKRRRSAIADPRARFADRGI